MEPASEAAAPHPVRIVGSQPKRFVWSCHRLVGATAMPQLAECPDARAVELSYQILAEVEQQRLRLPNPDNAVGPGILKNVRRGV